MEHTQIISLVPEGEYFDASAINEGVYLSVAHLNAIEAQLALSAGNIEAAMEEVSAANSAVDAAKQTIDQQAATIAALEEEVKTLKQTPAAPVSATTKEGDDFAGAPVFESAVTKEARRLREMRAGKK